MDDARRPPPPPRACCMLCEIKEVLVVTTLVLFCVDAIDIHHNVVRITGTTALLPWWGNATTLHQTGVMELCWYDLIVTSCDACSTLLLALAGECLASRAGTLPIHLAHISLTEVLLPVSGLCLVSLLQSAVNPWAGSSAPFGRLPLACFLT